MRLAQPGQFALDERQQLFHCLEMRGAAAYNMLRASAEGVVRPPRFAGELHDESVVRREPAPPRSVRFQLMPGGGIGGLTALPSFQLATGRGSES
jgi:hypothetical protein